jgi:hemerythrin superfamily protein
MANIEKLDATKLLSSDHRTVESLFEDFEKARGAAPKQKIVQKICMELKIHSMIEEEIFYPALRGKIEDDMLDEALVEHDGAKMLINDLESAEPDEEFYDAKVTVLQEQIEHHVKEEERERGSMFAQARKADVDLDALGEQMAARKAELLKQAKAGGLPPAEPSAVRQPMA